jgi:endoglucanase
MRWSAHAGNEPPYEIETDFMERARWAVDEALAQNLTVVINIHHFLEIMDEPEKQRGKLIALWDRIARAFAGYPDSLYFEVLNEPKGKLDSRLWNLYLAEAIAKIRESNPKRTIIAGPVGSNKIRMLGDFRLPEDDRNIIVTIHYYDPHVFTHQGADWTSDPEARNARGVTWNGTEEELAALRADFDEAASWAAVNARPIYLGEFGAYEKADIDSRARWTAAVAREAEARGFSFAYWEFCANFGAYNKYLRKWKPKLLRALIPATR